MPKRSSKPVDENQLAKSIVDSATSQQPAPMTPDGKNAAAVALGRLGGIKGGPARAAKLSKRKLKEIAKAAAIARWNKHK